LAVTLCEKDTRLVELSPLLSSKRWL